MGAVKPAVVGLVVGEEGGGLVEKDIGHTSKYFLGLFFANPAWL